MKDNHNIQTLTKNYDWNVCEKRFYDSLDFVDLFENYAAINRKKTISKSSINLNHYAIGYFHKNRLVRIETLGEKAIHLDTYLIWENDLLLNVLSFNNGIFYGKRYSNSIVKQNSWFYKYEDSRISEIKWILHADKVFFKRDELITNYEYKYDNEGLSIIYKTIEGDKLFEKIGKVILYDREKENFLKNCTISKTPLISKESKISDGIVDFKNLIHSKVCDSCGKPLTQILSLNLIDKRLNNKLINNQIIPVLYCFDCMATQQYSLSDLEIAENGYKPFTERDYKFSKESNEEKTKESFLKIGGQPDWIQDEEHPHCEKCNSLMKFIGQISANEQMTNGRDYLAFGDSGKLYVFSCCSLIKCIPQWY